MTTNRNAPATGPRLPDEIYTSYGDAVEDMGYTVLLVHLDGGPYEPIWRFLLARPEEELFGVLAVVAGCCELCDPLLACGTLEDAAEFREQLRDCVEWGTREEIINSFGRPLTDGEREFQALAMEHLTSGGGATALPS